MLRRAATGLAVASLVAGTQFTLAAPAVAGRAYHPSGSFHYSYGGYHPYYASSYRYHRGYRYRHHGYRYGYHGHSGVGIGIHGHGSDAALAVGALGAGLLLGHLLTRPQSRPLPTYSQARVDRTVRPQFGYGKRVARNCKPTTGRGLHRGRAAIFGGTFCYDATGQGYIVPGSEYLIGYADPR